MVPAEILESARVHAIDLADRLEITPWFHIYRPAPFHLAIDDTPISSHIDRWTVFLGGTLPEVPSLRAVYLRLWQMLHPVANRIIRWYAPAWFTESQVVRSFFKWRKTGYVEYVYGPENFRGKRAVRAALFRATMRGERLWTGAR